MADTKLQDVKGIKYIGIPWDKVAIPSADRSRGIAIADRYFLKGDSNYQTWCTVMKAHLGTFAAATALGTSPCPTTEPGLSSFLAWDQFALNSIMVSIDSDFISLLDGLNTSFDAWNALQKRFAPKDAQAALRVLKKFLPLQLDATDLNSLDKFEHQYTAVVSDIKNLNLSLDTICSAHLLGALPGSLSALETTISVNNPEQLPSVTEIFTLVRNEFSRSAISSNNAIGMSAVAVKNKSKVKPDPNKKPPSPCKFCKGDHWNIFCPKSTSGKPNAALANINESNFYEATGWHASAGLAGNKFPINAAILDSGATHHMSGNKELFHNFKTTSDLEVGGIGGLSKATGIGSFLLVLNNQNKVTLSDVLFVDGLSTTLISTSKLFSTSGLTTIFGKYGSVRLGNKEVATASKQSNGLYILDANLIPNDSIKTFTAVGQDSQSFLTWHKRFGHLNMQDLKKLIRNKTLSGLNVQTTSQTDDNMFNCNACLSGKGSRFPFPSTGRNRANVILGRIHSDLLTMSENSLSGKKYAITFVDDFSRKLWTQPLAFKSEAPKAIMHFISFVERSTGKSVVCFKSDNGGEYTSATLENWFRSKGITHETSTPYTPQQNGVAERVNRSIVEGILSMLADSGLPKKLWAEAMLTYTYCKNLSPHASNNGQIPDYIWHGKICSVSHLRSFGCQAWATKPQNLRKKLEPKANPFIFVGYELLKKAYRLYDPIKNMVIISRDVRFVENVFSCSF